MNAVDAAQRTLARAATFWAERAAAGTSSWGEGSAADVRARYTANGFRELDGFLRTLLAARAPTSGAAPRNTANTLRVQNGPADDCIRLRAIGRSTACLLHCAGWVRRPDDAAGAWMTAGWWGPEGDVLRRYPMGDRLQPKPDDVADVCGFYLRVGEALAG